MAAKKQQISSSKIIMTIITALFMCLIFLQSALPASASSAESQGFTNFINNFFLSLKLNIVWSHDFVRKLAHFAEFFVLGCLLTATGGRYHTVVQKGIFAYLFFSLAAAVTDETIQLFADGRAGMLQDVLLDFSGAAAGIAISLIFIFIKRAIRR